MHQALTVIGGIKHWYLVTDWSVSSWWLEKTIRATDAADDAKTGSMNIIGIKNNDCFAKTNFKLHLNCLSVRCRRHDLLGHRDRPLHRDELRAVERVLPELLGHL